MRWRGNKWAVLAVANLALFIVLLDRSLVTIAIPHILEALGGDLGGASWILNAYILAFVVVLIIGGRMGDLWGRRRLLLVGLGLFTAATLVNAVAVDLRMLVASRAVQGVGGALMLPQTLSLLTLAFPPGQRGLALGLWSAVSGLGTAVGPALGGVVVTTASWRLVFVVTVPFAALVFVGARRLVPESRAEVADRRLDWLGAALIVAVTASLTFATIEGGGLGWGSAPIVGLFALSALAAFAFWRVERGRPNALIPPFLFGSRTFTAGNLAGFLSFFGFVGLVFLLPLFLQGQLGCSAVTAGVLLTPLPAALMAASALAGRLTDWLGGRWLIVGGMALAAGGIWMLTGLSTPLQLGDLLPGLAVAGLGIGTAIAPTTTVVMGSVVSSRVGNASGILGTFRMAGAVFGIAVMSAVLQSRFLANLRAALDGFAGLSEETRTRLLEQAQNGAERLLLAGANGQLSGPLEAEITRQFLAAMETSFLVAAALSLAGALVALAIPGGAGRHR